MLKRQCRRMFIQLCIHWMMMLLLAPHACVPCSMPLYNDVSLPLAAGRTGQVQSPPGGAGVGRGGGMVSRACGTPIYILIYILRFISLS